MIRKFTLRKTLAATIVLTACFLLISHETASAMSQNVEIQAEYLQHRFFDDRFINNYNIHIFQKAHEQAGLTFHRGLTVTRAHGYTTEDGIYRQSNAIGLGPAAMVRWERPLTGKLYGDLEASGSFLLYNKAFPAQGRPWGFMWRIGPRFTYKYTANNSVSLGYMLSHSSNGMKRKNPGHHSIGFSLGFHHRF